MDYKSIAQGVFQVQNQVRKNPQSIIPKLEEMLKYFQGSLYKKPGEIPLQTNEGPNAIMECIQALKSTAPVCELTLADGLVRACNDHVNDIGPNGACSHSGSDGSTFTDRIERYGEWMGNIAENIEFGSSNPEEIVINLLVDDGCSNRGHRKNILNPKYKVVGVASGAHKGVRHCTVLDYASEYGPKGQGTWNNPPSAFGNDMGVSFGAKPAYTTNYTQPSNPTSYTNTFSAPTSNFGYGGNNPGAFGVPMTVSTTYTPGQQQQQQQPQFAPSQSQYQPQYAPSQSQYQPQQYQPQPQQYQSSQQQQPTSYTTYTTGPSSYTTGTAPTSYTTQPTYSAGQGTPSFSQQPQTNTYSTPSYSNPTSNYSGYSNPTPNQSPYTQTTQNVTQGPDGTSKQTTTTTTYSSSNNNWGSNPRDDFGFPQSTFQTKQFGDRDLLKDPFISEHLAKMKLTTDSSSTNLREMAQKEAPPGANGWSINSTIEIRNGQKYTKVVTTYSFPDGSKRDVIKEFMEGGL